MLQRVKFASSAVLLAAVLVWGSCAWAHHSFASTYSLQKIRIEGQVSEFLFRNPHCAVLVEVADKKGQKILWVAEWHTAGQLSRAGVEKDTLKPGDHVIITGNPSRNSADHRLLLEEISRPSDGWKWTD